VSKKIGENKNILQLCSQVRLIGINSTTHAGRFALFELLL